MVPFIKWVSFDVSNDVKNDAQTAEEVPGRRVRADAQRNLDTLLQSAAARTRRPGTSSAVCASFFTSFDTSKDTHLINGTMFRI